MKVLTTILVLLGILTITGLIDEAQAGSASFAVCVTVPSILELPSPPIPAEIEPRKGEIEPQAKGWSTSKIQTEEIRIEGNKKTILYTIVER